ncbi:hypothetical protein EDC18_102409 [Natranaerovirga pectinivora]|uniref:Uncharacterized protein n=1 Tax=Natranaerovirga pectinivora TaxID=682400 RepID=A0A4R3MP88_9FIRM|nr:hypothetical protein [Natranaerovirga pectinivora]TCT16390.1 hypothetical protein EDC18_102409 [Natranaerovirga pectinivora]
MTEFESKVIELLENIDRKIGCIEQEVVMQTRSLDVIPDLIKEVAVEIKYK